MFDYTTDKVTGFALEPSEMGAAFYFAVNHLAAAGYFVPAVYSASFDGLTLSDAVELSTFPIDNPLTGPILEPVTDIQSLAFDNGVLYASTGGYQRVLEIRPDGSWRRVSDTNSRTLPANLSIDPVTGRQLIGGISGQVAVMLDEAGQDGSSSNISNLTVRNGIQSLEGLAFSTPLKSGNSSTREQYVEGRSFDPSRLVNVSAWFNPEFHVSSFIEEESVYHVETTLHPLNPGAVRNHLAIGLNSVDRSLVNVSQPDVISPDGARLQDVSPLAEFDADGFLAGSAIDGAWLSVDNPHRSQFGYEFAVYGELNTPPAFTSMPRGFGDAGVIEVPIGTTFNYRPTASDLDRDAFTFAIDSGPVELVHEYVATNNNSAGGGAPATSAVSPNTFIFAPGSLGLGDFPVTLSVTDEFGAAETQSFTFRVVPGIGNQRPRFEAPYPTTVAYVGEEYRFALNAYDPDQDDLVYSLASDQPGHLSDFSVGPNTGLVTWTPKDEDVDLAEPFLVTVRVQDRADEVSELLDAELSFNIQVLPANSPPIFTTVPGSDVEPFIVDFEVAREAEGTDPNVSPQDINTTLADEQERVYTVSIPTTLDVKKADVVFLVDRTSDMALDLLANKGLDILSQVEAELADKGYVDTMYTNDAMVDMHSPGVQYSVAAFDGIVAGSDIAPICFDSTSAFACAQEADSFLQRIIICSVAKQAPHSNI